MATFNENRTTIPSDYVGFFTMDGSGENRGGNNATVTNATWETAEYGYISEQLSWGASTSFTYSSITYTNSYLIKNGVVIKNSGEVSSTALSGVSGNKYQGIFFYNRTLTDNEELSIRDYTEKSLGQSDAEKSNGFPFYTPASLNDGKVLEISRPQNGGTYYDQSGNGNNGTATNVTDSSNGLYNVMSFNGSSSGIVTTGLGLGTSSRTIIATIKPNTNQTGSNQKAFGCSNDIGSDSMFYLYDFNNTSFRNAFSIQNTTGSFFACKLTTTLTAGNTYRICGTFNSSTNEMKVYLNGILENTTTITGTIRNGDRFYQGRDLGNSHYNGDIINTIIHNRTLSDQEILEDYYSSYISN